MSRSIGPGGRRGCGRRGRGAAALAIRCIQAIADKNVAQLRELFAEDGKWELAYGLDGLSDAERTVHGGDKVARFHRGLNSVIAHVTFPYVEAFAVSDDLAFVEFRSEATTTKGQIVWQLLRGQSECKRRPNHPLGRVFRPEAGGNGSSRLGRLNIVGRRFVSRPQCMALAPGSRPASHGSSRDWRSERRWPA